MSTAAEHVWKGQTIRTIGQLVGALCALEGPEDGAEFMRVYRAVNEHADVNVGYCSGYCSPDTMRRILEWTRTTHPVLGVAPEPGDEFAPRRAFQAGMEMGKAAKS